MNETTFYIVIAFLFIAAMTAFIIDTRRTKEEIQAQRERDAECERIASEHLDRIRNNDDRFFAAREEYLAGTLTFQYYMREFALWKANNDARNKWFDDAVRPHI